MIYPFFIFTSYVVCSLKQIDYTSDLQLEEAYNAQISTEEIDSKFWEKIHTALENSDIHRYEKILRRAEDYVPKIPDENHHVYELIEGAITRLRQSQAYLARNVLKECGLTSSQENILFNNSIALMDSIRNLAWGKMPQFNMFNGDGKTKHEERMGKMLRLLKVHSDTGILTDLRESNKMNFDVVKYDIYNRGVPKTPKELNDIAYELVDLGTDMRRAYLGRITNFANAIVDSVQSEQKVNEVVLNKISAQVKEETKNIESSTPPPSTDNTSSSTISPEVLEIPKRKGIVSSITLLSDAEEPLSYMEKQIPYSQQLISA